MKKEKSNKTFNQFSDLKNILTEQELIEQKIEEQKVSKEKEEVFAAKITGNIEGLFYRIIRQDHRFSYGEDRYELIGRIEGRLYVLIYTPRQDGIRIISARKANPREVKRYENRSNEA